MNMIKENGSYRLIKFSDKFLVLDFSNKDLSIAVKTYISEEQAKKEFRILCEQYNTEKLIKRATLDSMINDIY